MEKCFYCEKEANVETFRNPYTKEIHPTCERCRRKLTSLKERLFYSRAIRIIPFFIAGSVVLIFFNWRWGLVGLIISVVLQTISIRLLMKKEIASTTGIDPRHLRWCKTCKSYRKIEKYDDLDHGIWRNEQLPDSSYIPCEIIDETIDVWQRYFGLNRQNRTLFPQDCPKWTKK
jgi:hypothetical protein